MLSVRAPVGVSGSEKRDRRRNRVDEHAGFMFLACLRWWTELALRMNRRGCRTACLHLELKDLKNIYFTSFLINMFIREVTVNIWWDIKVHRYGRSMTLGVADWNISATIGWIAMTFGANIHGAQRMDPTGYSDFSSRTTSSSKFPLMQYNTSFIYKINWHKFWSIYKCPTHSLTLVLPLPFPLCHHDVVIGVHNCWMDYHGADVHGLCKH